MALLQTFERFFMLLDRFSQELLELLESALCRYVVKIVTRIMEGDSTLKESFLLAVNSCHVKTIGD